MYVVHADACGEIDPVSLVLSYVFLSSAPSGGIGQQSSYGWKVPYLSSYAFSLNAKVPQGLRCASCGIILYPFAVCFAVSFLLAFADVFQHGTHLRRLGEKTLMRKIAPRKVPEPSTEVQCSEGQSG